ncbi:hypothetical protein STAFG_4730 [Streptomyces afghaniensis 772]|uniref:Uncharacterized protein n=1 Tax=Streptomyces afghaniensis 772 TaxID=1283301 RepID=S4MRP0_9ACTN|nr:hypothetical protein STAFG_4730 [Streptomyces afghaniensis 772]
MLYRHGRFLDVLLADSPATRTSPSSTSPAPGWSTPSGEGDTESLFACLSRLPPHVDHTVFSGSSLDGSTSETACGAEWCGDRSLGARAPGASRRTRTPRRDQHSLRACQY